MRTPALHLAVLLLLGSCASRPSLSLPLWADLAPGAYAVGYRVAATISVWYPARDEGDRLRFRDYLETLDELEQFLHEQKISAETVVALFDTPMYALANAPALAKRFPLIVIAQGNGQSAHDQAVLAEFLASHGHVVMTIPSLRVMSAEEMVPKAREQAAALAKAVEVVSEWPNVDPGPVALIGHSFGARVMLLHAGGYPTRSLVSLDGGIGTANQVEPLRTDRPLPPLLHLYQENDPRMPPDFTFLRSLRTETLLIERVDSLRHAQFSTWGFAASAFPELAKAMKADPAVGASISQVSRRVLRFVHEGA